MSPEEPGAPVEAEAPASEPTIDWGARLFPDGVPSSPPVVYPPPPPSQSDAPPPFFALSDTSVEDRRSEASLGSLGELCRSYLAEPPEAEEGESPRPLACSPIKASFKFTPTQDYLDVQAVRFFDGYAESFGLYVRVPEGWVELPVFWGTDDRGFPGCPSIVRHRAVEQVRVERGVLVVVMLGEDIAWVQDGEASDQRPRLTPQLVIAKRDGATVHTRRFLSQFLGGPSLGEKVQPAGRRVPWHALSWHDRKPFSVTADGLLSFAAR